MKSEDRSDIRLASLLAIYRRFIIIIYLLICWFNIVVCLVWTSFSYLLYCWLCEIELVKRCNIFFLRLSSFRFDLKIKILYFTISDRTNFKGHFLLKLSCLLSSSTVPPQSSDASEKIVELLNLATLEPDSSKKLDYLRTVQELLLHKVGFS